MKLNPDIKHEGRFDIKPETTKRYWFEHYAVRKKEAKRNNFLGNLDFIKENNQIY